MTLHRRHAYQLPADRRRWVRFTLPRERQLSVSFGTRQVDCTIDDVSLGGARLALQYAGPLPDTMSICEKGDDTCFEGRVAWRTKQSVGVAFDQSEASLLMVASLLRQTLDSFDPVLNIDEPARTLKILRDHQAMSG